MMKGMLKRALGVVAAAAMAVTGMAALSGTANAAVQSCNSRECTITISGSESQIDGHAFKYVKVASYDVYGAASNETEVLTLVTNPDIYDHVVKAVETATGEEVPTSEVTGKKVDPLAWAQQQDSAKLDDSHIKPWFGTTGTTRRFADTLRDVLSKDTEVIFGDAILTVSGPDNDGNVTASFTVGSPGLYLIVDQNAVDSKPATDTDPAVTGSTKAVPMLVGTKLVLNENTNNEVKYSDGTVDMKNDVMSITKTVNGSDHDSVQTGDYTKYEINTHVPQYAGYQVAGYQFTITDKFADDAPLAYAIDDETHPLTVTVNGQQLAKDVDYTITGFEDNSKTFTIDLTPYIMRVSADEIPAADATFINANLAGAPVVVSYYALVTGTTPEDGAINTATVKYPNDPTDNSKFEEMPSPETKVFNFDYIVSKIDRVTDEPLKGATFAIYEKGSNDYLQTYTTGEDGVAQFYGLKGSEEGTTYTIKEIKAPEGYLNIGVKFDVTITAHIEGENATAHVESVQYKVSGDMWNIISDEGKSRVVVENVKNITQLPLTGAAGTMLFTVLGLLIAAAGVTVYMKSRSVRKAMRA